MELKRLALQKEMAAQKLAGQRRGSFLKQEAALEVSRHEVAKATGTGQYALNAAIQRAQLLRRRRRKHSNLKLRWSSPRTCRSIISTASRWITGAANSINMLIKPGAQALSGKHCPDDHEPGNDSLIRILIQALRRDPNTNPKLIPNPDGPGSFQRMGKPSRSGRKNKRIKLFSN